MSNIRPISLQSCLGKLLSKVLAHRLGAIFARHPILNPSQRGFVQGGSTAKCIDELLDTWEWSRKGQHELYTLLYDIKQAYDSVQTDVLIRALRRIGLPPCFIALVRDSLTGLTSYVRTVYGPTRVFDVLRSIRQGDPLAPLLFVILMDALHDGLHTNPFTHKQEGLRMQVDGRNAAYLPSLGYADDTGINANTLPSLSIQHQWVQYFMQFNRMRLNATKCELIGRNAAGEAVSQSEVDAHNLFIDGQPLQPIPHSQSIRYLGVHTSFDGSWAVQQHKSLQMIQLFTRAVSKFSVSIAQAVYMFNVFLLPKLELALRYVHGKGTKEWIQSCDRLIIGSIKYACGSPLKLSHSAVALTIGLLLPSWLEVGIKVSELFLRVNSLDDRWGQLGRIKMRRECGSSVDTNSILPHLNHASRMPRACRLATMALGWSMKLEEEYRPDARRHHLFDSKPIDDWPILIGCSSVSTVSLQGGSEHLVQDLWQGWGTNQPSRTVHVYTDGSYQPALIRLNGSASWAVVVADVWLHNNYVNIPSDEGVLQSAHVAGACMMGRSISCVQSVYPAELQAIARALAMVSLCSIVYIHSDSQASLGAIMSFQQQNNERKALRMSARPLLCLISYLIGARYRAGGRVFLVHVKAHTKGTDIHSVGNRLADYQANLARSSDLPCPRSLLELPTRQCERYMHIDAADGIHIVDDIRRCARRTMRQHAFERWQQKSDLQGHLACQGMIDLGNAVMRFGSAIEQCTVVHVATNSIEYLWMQGGHHNSALHQLQCSSICVRPLTLEHLSNCDSDSIVQFRANLQLAMVSLLRRHCEAYAWLQRHQNQPLHSFLSALIPEIGDDVHVRHRTLMMCGAFTNRQGSQALRQLTISDPAEGQRLLNKLRLLCLQHIHSLYTKRKQQAVASAQV